MPSIDPLLAMGVVLSTMATDAAYVLFNAAVSARRRVGAATWSSVWYLLSAFAVLIGAELNAELERQTRVDTTVGSDKPIGQRGASAADTVGEAGR